MDVFVPWGDKRFRDAADIICKSAPLGVSAIWLSCGASGSAHGAYGVRAAWPYRFSSGWQIGPSLGYLYGGPSAGKISYAGVYPVFGPGSEVFREGSVTSTNHTVRLLLEGGKKFAAEGPWAGAITAGVGGALVNQRLDCAAGGNICRSRPFARLASSNSGEVNTFWFAWELTPSIFYKSWEFGVRHAQFYPVNVPAYSAMPWRVFGGTLGYHF